ncbi:MAG: ECF transporter S component [Candidatus Cloacimonadaceae bacterium]|nr:ECF transporter S component [Candidatus Cloacimonadaceae bacterium]
MLKHFSSKDLIIISLLAAIGIAIKPLVTPTIKMVSAPLMLPGGSLAGGLYMMWLVLTVVLVPRFGSGILFGFVQALVTFMLGWFGNHGALSLLTYTLPGLVADGIRLLNLSPHSLWGMTVICSLANLTGSLIMSLIIFQMPLVPLLISSITAIFSGIMGGILAFLIYKKLHKTGLVS